MFYYIPTPDQAAASIQTLTFLVPYGGLVRNLHYWAAQFLVVVSVIHLLRVVLTGSYSPPRRFNYLLGMGLFVLAVLLDFTGYVLRWDEGVPLGAGCRHQPDQIHSSGRASLVWDAGRGASPDRQR